MSDYTIAAGTAGEAPLRLTNVPAREHDDVGYCGCCGDELGPGRIADAWCDGCAEHVTPTITAPGWSRTFFAQYGRPCPYQVPPVTPF